jgi:hypothetical protein
MIHQSDSARFTPEVTPGNQAKEFNLGFPSGRSYHLHRGTLELCQSDHRVLGHLPDQGPSAPIARFGWAASSRKSLGGSKLLSFNCDGGHCVLGDLQCCRNVLVPFPRSVNGTTMGLRISSRCIKIAIDKMCLFFEAYACSYHNPTAIMGHSVHNIDISMTRCHTRGLRL